MASTRTASTPARKSTTRKSAAAGAAQHANAQGQPQGTPAPSPAPAQDLTARANAIVQESGAGDGNGRKTDDANLVMPHIQHSILVSHMKAATAGFKAAINLEIAVACAVFVEAGDTGVKAKKELYAVYRDAGYDCEVGGTGKDYKTVNRRIGYAAQFYDAQAKDALKTVMGEARDEAALQVLVAHLATKYNFRSMSDVQEAAGVVPASRQPRSTGGQQDGGGNAVGGTPQGGNGGGGAANAEGQSVFKTSAAANPTGVPGQPDAGDQGVMGAVAQAAAAREASAANRREYDDQSKWVRYTYEGATIIVPVEFKVASLHELGIKLVQAAAHMRGDRIDMATLNAEFKEAVAAH